MPEAVIPEGATFPDGADGVAGEDGVEVVDSTHATVGEGLNKENGGVSRPEMVLMTGM